MPSTRRDLLSALKPGDVIFGLSGAGNDKLLLVTERTKREFKARHIPTQSWAEFDLDGQAIDIPTGGTCTIVSVAPLSAVDYATAIGLDEKIRDRMGRRGLDLTRAEVDLVTDCGKHFRAHLLPEE